MGSLGDSSSSGDVTAELAYLQRLELYKREKPFQLFIPIDLDGPDPRQTNLEFEMRSHVIYDMRPDISRFKLDVNGFEVRNAPFRGTEDPTNFQCRNFMESEYLPYVRELLKSIDGGFDRIFFFDFRIRDSNVPLVPVDPEQKIDLNDLSSWRQPATRIHVDQSARSVAHRVQLQLPKEAPFLLQGRISKKLSSAWRPIHHPVEAMPLALCDASSMAEDDLVRADHIRRKFKGETLLTHYSPHHKWYYVSKQTPDEVILFKNFDSDPHVKAQSRSFSQVKPHLAPPGKGLALNYLRITSVIWE
ncbi:methyltransferase CmcJ [Xylaria scruposa]|nr:methyltransferase CmcJ [Xylaria scruposa]